jgi:hypothetical protein
METIYVPILCPAEFELRSLCCYFAAVVLVVLLVVLLMWEGLGIATVAVVVEVFVVAVVLL